MKPEKFIKHYDIYSIFTKRDFGNSIYNKSEYFISDYTVHVELSVYPDHTTGAWFYIMAHFISKLHYVPTFCI